MEQAQEKRPTLRSLAEITGLGISTVSQALRDSPEISEETRKRVKLAALQAGYRPNRAGVRLRTGKTNVITVVLNPQDSGSGFFADFVFGISDGLAGTPYHLVVTPYSLEDPMAPIRYIVETGSADGVIFSRLQPDDPRVRFLSQHAIPFACHGRTDMGLAHPFYDFDNDRFGFEAVSQLARRGRRRLALLGPPPGLTYESHTYAGFERGLIANDCESVPIGSAHAESPLADVDELARRLCRQPNPPDGYICSNAAAAAALASSVAAEGFEIGKDFDVICKSLPELLHMLLPQMLFVPESFRAAGHSLARLVIAAINGEPVEQLQIVSFA
ncbi:MAG: LacI family transcriptional regulator [Phyllobacteriaceae bacterium]|nr:LacI family transcriptional regulator [Phyllobacteriaceae bacterium]